MLASCRRRPRGIHDAAYDLLNLVVYVLLREFGRRLDFLLLVFVRNVQPVHGRDALMLSVGSEASKFGVMLLLAGVFATICVPPRSRCIRCFNVFAEPSFWTLQFEKVWSSSSCFPA